MGVALELLSPSASPERVWLYAAELDEHSLAAAHSDFYPVAVRQHAQSAHSLVSWNPEYHQFRIHSTGDQTKTNLPMTPGIPCRAMKDAPIGQEKAKPAEVNPNDAQKTDVLPTIR
jgi:hypothetical protein